MAQSLQAALVVPVVLSALAGMTGLILPVLKTHEQVARQFVIEQHEQLTLESLYQIPEHDRTALLTSPQQVIAWLALAEDVIGLVKR
ncbi:MAG: hypothetical protein EOM08_02830 [Clostridia bacterium]|nr:hypothetical protein [Clostridia bacterium]NCC75350.1 hypothetical protein [Clostridia bacterium]